MSTASSRPVPASTYRLQLGPELDFATVCGLVDRLRALGVTHLYLSPILQAAPGSTHGYDTADHRAISTELGGRGAFDELAAAVLGAGMGLVVDVVPNHMSIADARANRWWWDVLEHGPRSRYADHFDITWESHEVRQRDTVLLPVLGDHYGRVLDAGELTLAHTPDGFVVQYFDHVFPLSTESIGAIMRPLAGASIDDRLAEINADTDALHDILELQHYQLCHWRRAQHDLDYRRFFDIDTLIGVRVEQPDVFADTHDLVLELVGAGLVDGLRIDHPDGLADPTGYFDRLTEATGGVWTVVEKILEPGEPLRPGWPVDGTTGYEFATAVGGLLRDPEGVDAITRWWEKNVDPATWSDVVLEAKDQIVRTVLAADVARLADVGVRLCERHRRHRDHTRHDVTRSIRALLRVFPVYRTYVTADGASARDRSIIERACVRAAELDPEIDDDLNGFLRAVLTGEHAGQREADEFVRRFQQLTGPAMAKSVEDTAFYRYMPVVAANEVGADPGRPVLSIGAFHDHNLEMHEQWPNTMTTLSTHDTKRSADVRARLAVLTERAERWLEFCDRWLPQVDRWWGAREPDRAVGHLALQTVVGAWPIDADRLRAYLEKATKEAKEHTSWTDADEDYDRAVSALAGHLVSDETFVSAVEALVAEIIVPGRIGACAQQLLHLTSPGVPDLYQGNELWDLSLVDPDNRRPVDHGLRAELLQRLASAGGPDIVIGDDDLGAHKLWLTHLALDLRRRRPASFGAGDAGRYRPIDAGPSAVAFGRGDDVVAAATVRPVAVGSFDVVLPDGRWTDLLTGEEHVGRAAVAGFALFERRGV